jgi:hypothetical protein
VLAAARVSVACPDDMERILWLLWMVFPLSLLCRLAHGQTSLPPLPPAQMYANGSFLFPNGSPQSFQEGTPMNITWKTIYNSSNLYLIQGSNFNDPQAVVGECARGGDVAGMRGS